MILGGTGGIIGECNLVHSVTSPWLDRLQDGASADLLTVQH
jgi:hypothetical protein